MLTRSTRSTRRGNGDRGSGIPERAHAKAQRRKGETVSRSCLQFFAPLRLERSGRETPLGFRQAQNGDSRQDGKNKTRQLDRCVSRSIVHGSESPLRVLRALRVSIAPIQRPTGIPEHAHTELTEYTEGERGQRPLNPRKDSRQDAKGRKFPRSCLQSFAPLRLERSGRETPLSLRPDPRACSPGVHRVHGVETGTGALQNSQLFRPSRLRAFAC
jgi:hypothetical protein